MRGRAVDANGAAGVKGAASEQMPSDTPARTVRVTVVTSAAASA